MGLFEVIDDLQAAIRDKLEAQPYGMNCSCGADVEYTARVDDDGDLLITLDECHRCNCDDEGVDPYDVDIDIQCNECDATLTVTRRDYDGTICLEISPCKCMQGSLKIGG